MAISAPLAPDWTETSDPARLPETPLVSVLMPAFNHGPFLDEAIASVLAQQASFRFELLIGEDCSRDDTLAIALRAQRQHPSAVRVIASHRNAGMHANHRHLVESSRGRYVAYCEGDDYWNSPHKLSQQVAFLESHPGYAAVHSEFSHIVARGRRWKALPRYNACRRGHIPEGDVLHALLAGNFIQTCTLLAETEAVRAYLSSPLPVSSYKIVDWALCLSIASHRGIGYIDEPLATYRKTPGSATNVGHLGDIARAEDSMRMATDYCRLLGLPAEVEANAHANATRHIVDKALCAGQFDRYASAVQWLTDNPAGGLSRFQTGKHALLRSSPWLRRAYCSAGAISSAFRTWRTYTAPAPRPASARIPE